MKKSSAAITLEFDELYLDQDQDLRYDQGDLKELAQSLKESGMVKPMLVASNTELGNYKVIDGHRRYRAMEMLIEEGSELPSILAIKVDAKLNHDDHIAHIMLSNSGKPMTSLEQAEVVGYLNESDPKKWSAAKIAAAFGKSPMHIGNLLKLDSVAEDIKEAIKAGKIAATTVFELVKGQGLEEAEAQIRQALAKLDQSADDEPEFDFEDEDEAVEAPEPKATKVKVKAKDVAAKVQKVSPDKIMDVVHLWEAILTMGVEDEDTDEEAVMLQRLQKEANVQIPILKNIHYFLMGEIDVTEIYENYEKELKTFVN